METATMQKKAESASSITILVTTIEGVTGKPFSRQICHKSHVTPTRAICSKNCDNAGTPVCFKPK